MPKKFLAICAGGMVRSGGMKFAITYGQKLGECIALGVEANSQETIRNIARLVDHVILMDESLKDGIPAGIEYYICDVGPDVYGTPFHPDLQTKINNWLKLMKNRLV